VKDFEELHGLQGKGGAAGLFAKGLDGESVDVPKDP
jgi:hypothetical protein